MKNGKRRLGIAGAGLPGLDKQKASEGVVCTIPGGHLEGVQLRIRRVGRTNSRHNEFMEEWAKGRFREAIKSRNGKNEEADLESIQMETLSATQTPEYLAHVLVADLPQGVEIPEEVEDLEKLPEAIHDCYTKDNGHWRRKKNKKDWVPYSPEIGVWLFSEDRYPELRDWAWRFAGKEEQFLEAQLEQEGNG